MRQDGEASVEEILESIKKVIARDNRATAQETRRRRETEGVVDRTPEAIQPLLDKEINGFGELFRMLSWEEIGASTLQSRALGGLANATLIFCLPGSTGACRTGWDRILQAQLDARTQPCNLVELLPRLRER